MNLKSDLAMELMTDYKSRQLKEDVVVTNITVDEQLSKKIGKPRGEYITIESKAVASGVSSLYSTLSEAIADSLKQFTLNSNNVLVIGLGNPMLTADALGSKVLEHLIVTRHLFDSSGEDCVKLSAFSPNVMGVTGIESYDIVSGIVNKITPDLVIAVDSLASSRVSRLAAAFQICSSGITPGSGVCNHRQRLDRESLGVNVISIGVPLVVYADVIIADALKNSKQKSDVLSNVDDSLASLIVTPKEIDILVEDCGRVIADAINSALRVDKANRGNI